MRVPRSFVKGGIITESKRKTSLGGFVIFVVVFLMIISGAFSKIFGGEEKKDDVKNTHSAEYRSDDRSEEPNDTSPPTEAPTQPRTHGNTNEYISAQENHVRHSYDALINEKQREIYRNIEYVVGNITDKNTYDLYDTEPFELTGSYRLESSDDYDMRAAYIAFKADNPQVFWIRFYRIVSFNQKTVVYIQSRYTSTETDRMKMNLSADIAVFRSRLPGGLSVYEKEKYIHDYLISRCEYNEEIYSALNDPQKRESIYSRRPMLSTAYGALHDGDAVCTGYACAFQLLCQCAGLDCVCINGYADEDGEYDMDNSGHTWNAVNLGYDWYMVDTTWDDKDDAFFSHLYFNVTTPQMKEDHMMSIWETGSDGVLKWNTNLFMPLCNKVHFNYFVFDSDCRTITDISGNQLYSVIMNAINQGRNSVTLYLDPSCLLFGSAKEALFDRGRQSVADQLFYRVLDNTRFTWFEYQYWANPSRSAVQITFSLS